MSAPEPVRSGEGDRARAAALLDLGRYSEAADAARSALATAPDDPWLTLLLAIALSEVGELDEAEQAAGRVVALTGGSARALRTLGWVTYKQGRHREAAELLAQSLARDAHDPDAHVMRAEALLKQQGDLPVRLGRNLVDQAERHAADAVRLAPQAAGGYLMQGKVWVARSDAARTEHWARRALAIEPGAPLGHQLLGMAAQIRGDARSAADHYVAAGRLDPRGSGSMEMLRSIRSGWPIGGIALFVVVRIVAEVSQVAGMAALALALVFVAALILYSTVWRRWHVRRVMSDEARRALDRDRTVRGRLRHR